ncbi:uncharacterized protein LOC127287066 [Leptopilina boulardi]|uniref:uncharacterized protein LOC127287066 n=1 Tax=Leptopilina boulardi TaxID=63433 RepID=UPI0021F67535|nr:uncharacterized protein LOC127287066 [Leptopilina boulardi]
MFSKFIVHVSIILQVLYVSHVHTAFVSQPYNKNDLQLNNYEPDIEPYDDSGQTEKPIFNYRKNGFRVDVRIVSPLNNNTIMMKESLDDHFPKFPVKEIGLCIIDLSMTCVQRRVVRFLDVIKQLKEITLFGQTVKMVRTKVAKPVESNRNLLLDGLKEKIDRSIDEFFETFVLRITLPKWNGKNNQINLMFDDTDVEGRGKQKKGGGKCKKMMMCMMMMVKMKLMAMGGMMAMKGMLFSGMSIMMIKAMLIQKLMSLKGGGGGGWNMGGGGWNMGGGGWNNDGGHGGGQYKEVVLLTKSNSDGGGGCGGGGHGSSCSSHGQDSYSAPPSSSYGAPSSGGGYSSGGGGGWGRSFNNNPLAINFNNPQQLNNEPLIGKSLNNYIYNINTNNTDKDDEYVNLNSSFVKNEEKNMITSNNSKIFKENHQNDNLNFKTIKNNHRETFNENTQNNTLNFKNLQPVYVKDWRNYNSSTIRNILYPNALSTREKKTKI